MSQVFAIDGSSKENSATIGHRPILTTTTDSNTWPGDIHRTLDYAGTCGLHPYFLGDMVARSITELENHRPNMMSFLKMHLDRQAKAEEKLLFDKLIALSVKEPLFIYSLLVKANPVGQDYAYTNPDQNKLSSHSISEASAWRSNMIYVPNYSVYRFMSTLSIPMSTPPTPADIIKLRTHLPDRYFSQWSLGGTNEDREICRNLRPIDGHETDAIIAAEVAVLSDIARYNYPTPAVEAVLATDTTPAIEAMDSIPGDSESVILAKIHDSTSISSLFSSNLKIYEDSVSNNLKVNASLKKFVDEVIPLASVLCDNLVLSQSWGQIIPYLEQHFILTAQFSAPDTKLPVFNTNGGIQHLKYHYKQFVAKNQVLEQLRDATMNANPYKLSFGKTLDSAFLTDSAWRLKHPHGPNKATRDHSMRENFRSMLKNTEFDGVIDNLLQRNASANHLTIIQECEQYERLHPREKVKGRPVSVSLTTAKRARDEMANGDCFCLLHSVQGGRVQHDTDDCKIINAGKTKPDPKGTGWHVFADTSKVWSKVNDKDNVGGNPGKKIKTGNDKDKHGGKPSGDKPGKGKGNMTQDDYKKTNAELFRKVHLLEIKGSVSEAPACSICLKQYQSHNATIADVASHSTAEHGKWKRGRSIVNAVTFDQFKVQMDTLTSTTQEIQAAIKLL